jgi:hypothetical protein
MLQRGDLVPQFEVRTVDGDTFDYSTAWQRSNLLLITLPEADSDTARRYVSALAARAAAIREHETEYVVTRDRLPGTAVPGALVADRWGEVLYVAAPPRIDELPALDELMVWLDYLQRQCPECEGEAR